MKLESEKGEQTHNKATQTHSTYKLISMDRQMLL